MTHVRVRFHFAYLSHDCVVSCCVFISRLQSQEFCVRDRILPVPIAVTRILRQRLTSPGSHSYAYPFRMFLTAE